MTTTKSTLTVAAALVLLTASSFAQEKEKAAPRGGDFRLGALQRSLKEGLTTTEVFEIAGSPNLVTRGRDGRETWVYDKMSMDASEKGIHVGGGGSAAGGSAFGILGFGGGASKKSMSQSTLMLAVTFTAEGRVETFTYRSSRF